GSAGSSARLRSSASAKRDASMRAGSTRAARSGLPSMSVRLALAALARAASVSASSAVLCLVALFARIRAARSVVLFALPPGREVTRAVDEGEHVDRVGVDLVDQAIALHEDLADRLVPDLRVA